MFSFLTILILSPRSLFKYNLQYSISWYNKCHTICFRLIHRRHRREVIWQSYAVIFCYGHEKTYCKYKNKKYNNKSNRVRTTDAFSGKLPAYLSLNSLLNGIRPSKKVYVHLLCHFWTLSDEQIQKIKKAS